MIRNLVGLALVHSGRILFNAGFRLLEAHRRRRVPTWRYWLIGTAVMLIHWWRTALPHRRYAPWGASAVLAGLVVGIVTSRLQR